MDGDSLYETDILAWSEAQAAALRALAGRRDLPNALDLDNLVEEVEALGRSELRAATSLLRLILTHLLKLAAAPEAPSRAHWIAEIANWQAELRGTWAPSMRQKLDMDAIWADARQVAAAQLAPFGDALPAELPDTCPISLDALLDRRFDLLPALDALRHG